MLERWRAPLEKRPADGGSLAMQAMHTRMTARKWGQRLALRGAARLRCDRAIRGPVPTTAARPVAAKSEITTEIKKYPRRFKKMEWTFFLYSLSSEGVHDAPGIHGGL